MKIYFATWLTDRSLGTSLNNKNGNCRLLSFHFLIEQEITNPLFQEYIATGSCDPRKNKEK